MRGFTAVLVIVDEAAHWAASNSPWLVMHVPAKPLLHNGRKPTARRRRRR